MNGFAVCRQLREDPWLREAPAVSLTARSEGADRVHGLETGGDDNVVKPFSVRELLARVKLRMRGRRGRGGPEPICRRGGLEIEEDPSRPRHIRSVRGFASAVRDTDRGASILHTTARAAKHAVNTRKEIDDPRPAIPAVHHCQGFPGGIPRACFRDMRLRAAGGSLRQCLEKRCVPKAPRRGKQRQGTQEQ